MKVKVIIPGGSTFRGTTEVQTTTHYLVVHESNRLGEWIAKKFCYGQETKALGKAKTARTFENSRRALSFLRLVAGVLGIENQLARETANLGVRLHNPSGGQTSPDGHKRKDELLHKAAKSKKSRVALSKVSRSKNGKRK